jgi:predicted ABC-type transport system involved in lysophospholipase L1 biosynthesis ATPase subunit
VEQGGQRVEEATDANGRVEMGSVDPHPLLRATGLHKVYSMGSRELHVLVDVEFEVRAGQKVAVVGASGSGKSTLLNCLAGLDTPNAGEVWLNGTSLYRQTRSARARLRAKEIGFIFQSYQLIPELDALENVLLPARILRKYGEAERNRGRALLESLGLKDRMRHRPHELSGGEQQRVATARALINTPALLFADEPTGNLDSTTGERVLEAMIEACALAQAAIVLVTHDEGISKHFPRVLTMADGRLFS